MRHDNVSKFEDFKKEYDEIVTAMSPIIGENIINGMNPGEAELVTRLIKLCNKSLSLTNENCETLDSLDLYVRSIDDRLDKFDSMLTKALEKTE